MATKYRLNFESIPGSDINWRININNEDYSGTVLDLKGQSNPITIEWPKDRDIYKPIRGSSAKLNLLLEDGDTLDDFNSGGQYEWEVELEYGDYTPQITTPLEFEDNQLMVGDVLRIVSSGTYAGEVEMTVMDTNSTDPADRISQTNLESVLEVGDFIVLGGERYEVLFIGAFSDGVDARLVIDKESISGITKGEDILLETQAEVSDFNLYWRGWIEPVEGEESVGSFPISVSFTATDQLGLLDGQSVPTYSGLTSKSLISYFQDALLDTGLGLDLYVDTAINSSAGDAIVNLDIDERVFLGDDNLDDRDNLKDALEGILLAFNCSLYQSDGAWWITNNSLHGGTGTNESRSFTYYEFDAEGEDHYNAATTQSVDLLKGLRTPQDAQSHIETVTFTELSTDLTSQWIFRKVDGTTSSLAVGFGGDASTDDNAAGLAAIINSSADFPVSATSDGNVTTITWGTNGALTDPVITTSGWGNGAATFNTQREGQLAIATQLEQRDQSLYLLTQQPYGSIECVPKDLKSENYIQNSDFTDGSSGWTTFSQSKDSTLYVDTTESLNGNAIRTDRTSATRSDNDTWFYNSDESQVERDYPFEISFDWATDIKSSSIDTVELSYALIIEFDDDPVDYTSYDYYAATYGQSRDETEYTTDRLQYNWRTNSWLPSTQGGVNKGEDWRTTASTTKDSVWDTHSETIFIDGKIQPGSGDVPTSNPKVIIYFFYPVAIDSDGDEIADSTTIASTYVDNINIRNNYKEVNYEPHFERVQDSYNTTLRYEPKLMADDDSPAGYYNTLSTSTFNRRGAIESLGLEEVVTQLKINDYREQLKYYQGQLINTVSTPLAPHHKVGIEYNEYDEVNDGYGTCVINGGSFNPKQNTFDVCMHVPNQGTDLSGTTFHREDVTLVGATPPDRSNAYTFVIQPRGVDSDGNPIKTDDSEGRSPGDTDYVDTFESLQPSVFYIPFSDPANTRVRGAFFLDPVSGKEIDANSVKQIDDENRDSSDDNYVNTTPAVETVSFTDQNGRVFVEFDFTVPKGNVTEIFYVQATLIDEAAVAGQVAFEISTAKSGSDQNYTIVPPSLRYEGVAGSVINGEFALIANSGFEFTGDAQASATSDDTDLVIGTDSYSDGTITQPFTLTLPSAADTATVTFTGSPSAADNIANNNVVITLENGDDDNTLTGAAWVESDLTETYADNGGSNKTYTANIAASDGYSIKEGDLDVNVGGDDASQVSNEKIIVGANGETAQLSCNIVTPSDSNAAITFTLHGTATSDPYVFRLELDLTDSSYIVADRLFADIPFNKGNSDDNDQNIPTTDFFLESNNPMEDLAAADDLTVTHTNPAGTTLTTTLTVQNTNQLRLRVTGAYPDPPSSGNMVTTSLKVGGEADYIAATSGDLLVSSSLSIDARSQAVNIPVLANGIWVVEVSGNSSNRQTNTLSNTSPDGAIIVTPLENTSGSSRTFTCQLFGSTDGSVANKIDTQLGTTVTITQSGDYNISGSGNYSMVISGDDPDPDTDSNIITFVT